MDLLRLTKIVKKTEKEVEMKPDQFSKLGMYGNKKIFKKIARRGYTEVAFGGGEWVNGIRIVAIFVFYHPQKEKIATYQQPKSEISGSTMRGRPFQKTYSTEKFAGYQRSLKITLGRKFNLSKLLKNWK